MFDLCSCMAVLYSETDRKTETDRQTDRETDRQTDKLIDRQEDLTQNLYTKVLSVSLLNQVCRLPCPPGPLKHVVFRVFL